MVFELFFFYGVTMQPKNNALHFVEQFNKCPLQPREMLSDFCPLSPGPLGLKTKFHPTICSGRLTSSIRRFNFIMYDFIV